MVPHIRTHLSLHQGSLPLSCQQNQAPDSALCVASRGGWMSQLSGTLQVGSTFICSSFLFLCLVWGSHRAVLPGCSQLCIQELLRHCSGDQMGWTEPWLAECKANADCTIAQVSPLQLFFPSQFPLLDTVAPLQKATPPNCHPPPTHLWL